MHLFLETEMNQSLKLWQLSTAIVFTMIFGSAAFSQETKTASKTSMSSFKEISFKSLDGLEVTADLYWKHDEKSKPFIVLCHQAGWSRGEYREIAPMLNELGFNCMAIDQRSGGAVEGVSNQTASRATRAKKSVTFVDAEQDMIAAIKYARGNYANGKLVLWGSSYSSALALRIAGEHADKVDGVLAFAPGEYFARQGKPGNWIENSARKITAPVFVTSAKREHSSWKAIFKSISAADATSFLPETAGNHGSRALWRKFGDSKDYWVAVKGFLVQFQQ